MKNLKTFEELNENENTEIEFSNIQEFKAADKKAYDSLVEFWADMSRVDSDAAKRYLKKVGDRFTLKKTKKGDYTFYDEVTEDTFQYYPDKNNWNYILMGGKPVTESENKNMQYRIVIRFKSDSDKGLIDALKKAGYDYQDGEPDGDSETDYQITIAGPSNKRDEILAIVKKYGKVIRTLN